MRLSSLFVYTPLRSGSPHPVFGAVHVFAGAFFDAGAACAEVCACAAVDIRHMTAMAPPIPFLRIGFSLATLC